MKIIKIKNVYKIVLILSIQFDFRRYNLINNISYFTNLIISIYIPNHQNSYLEQISLDFKEVLAYNISVERHDERIRYNRKGLVGS